jgi:4-hydroxyphenylpyruvate dioxygenase
MRKSIATVCISGTLEQKIQAASEAGFDDIEIFEPDLVACPRSPAEIRQLAEQSGLGISLFQPFRDLESVGEEQFQKNLERLRAKCEVMASLGCDLLLVTSNVATASDPDPDTAVRQLRHAAEVVQEYGIRIAYEALAWGAYVDDYRTSWERVEAVDHPAFGLCLDSFHILSKGHPLEDISSIPGEKIFFVQLADAPQMSLDQLSWSRHHRVFPGEGSFAVAEFVARAVGAGYQGPLSLEIFNDLFRQSNALVTAKDGARSLTWIESQARDWAAHNGVSVPEGTLDSLAEVAEPTSITFVEIGGPRDPELIETLTFFGFSRVGTHQSKLIELWSNGEARLIINPGARSTEHPHIRGIGVAVESLEKAQQRSQELGMTPVVRQKNPDEADLFGFSAPDGTEVFLDQLDTHLTPPWWREFSGATATGPGSISGIDHVNLTQPWHYFDSAVLFYTSFLSLGAQESLDVAAPLGLVRSQVMRNTSGSVRLALNVFPPPDGPVGLVHTPQHIAFATGNIAELARGALERGIELLPVGENYYKDLGARFGLDDDFLADLRALNLLYDRDDSGEFLHFYTKNFGGLFLEVVERRGNYDGYGAPNAPIRLAAQHRAH